MASETVTNLFHRRWAVRVLAVMHRSQATVGGVRYVMLCAELGISRESLRETLSSLIHECGWVARHAGYGHPLRPEYVLTVAGLRVADWSSTFVRLADSLPETTGSILYNKWSVPVIGVIRSRTGNEVCGARFGSIKAELPGITPRALTRTLKDLCRERLVNRIVVGDAYPPRTAYLLEQPILPIADHLQALQD